MSQFCSTICFVCGIRELVRGQELIFLEELQPLVRAQPVRLNMSSIERIDAAGLAALVSLYCDALKAGHEFSAVNPSRHVIRILAIVGLDRVLLSNHSGLAKLTPQHGRVAA
jgi:anti-anti-sigma factor